MLNDFQKHILEEIEETGDYAFILLIPYFLEIEKVIGIRTNGGGIGAHSENYHISDYDFIILKGQVIDLFSEYNLGIYKYIGFEITDKANKMWEDAHILLSKKEIDEILNNKVYWIYKPNNPGYIIAEKD